MSDNGDDEALAAAGAGAAGVAGLAAVGAGAGGAAGLAAAGAGAGGAAGLAAVGAGAGGAARLEAAGAGAGGAADPNMDEEHDADLNLPDLMIMGSHTLGRHVCTQQSNEG